MSNSYYNHTTFPGPFAPGASANMRTELQRIASGFDLLPVLAGNNSKLVRVNAAGTALEVAGTLDGYSFSNVTITGGTITGITDLAVADGGTGVGSLTTGALLRGAGTGPVEFLVPGSVGNVLQSNGTAWVGAPAPVTTANTLVVVRRNSSATIVSGDRAKLIEINGGGSTTQTFDNAVDLGPDWYVFLSNADTVPQVILAAGGETVDGLSGYPMYPGEMRMYYPNAAGTGVESKVLNAFEVTFNLSGTFTKPPGYAGFNVYGQGGGGGGGGGYLLATPSASISGGGGGGGGVGMWRHVKDSQMAASLAVTIGAGGAGGAGATSPGNGGNGGGGGSTTVSGVLTVNGGNAGNGGVAVGAASGGAHQNYFSGFSTTYARYVISGTGGSCDPGTQGGAGDPTLTGGSGGGGGGGVEHTAPTHRSGGLSYGQGFASAHSAGGTTNGQAGASATSPGTGGGGGAGGNAVSGGNGGAGLLGGGGGGGGAGTNNVAGGNGGNGGAGFVVIIGVI